MATKTVKKVFSKEEWLKAASADKETGVLTEREINDACALWVNDLDGKSADEIEDNKRALLRDDWFIEV